MNEPNVVHLSQEKPPASQQVLSEDPDGASIQEVGLQTIEATAPTGAPDGQEAYEQGMGLSLRKSGKQEEAVAAFRRALQVPSTSSKEQVQILYLLGRTLESLDRIPEALETYRWLLREAPQYRDVTMKIESLSTKRTHRQIL